MTDPIRAVAYIALGANLDDPARHIQEAIGELDRLPDTRLAGHSSLYRSRPEGFSEQPDFINAVARVETGLTPRALLSALLDIEHRHGRSRTFRNAPRTLDLDILLYDQLRLDESGLHLPHPRMHERAFVLQPLAEIAPDSLIPGHGRVDELLKRLNLAVLDRLDA